MHLSLTEACNLTCRHCRRGHHFVRKNEMSKEMLDHIIHDFFPYICALRIGGSDLGEQMLSPYFNYFLGQIRRYPIDVELVTNGTFLSEDNVEELVSSLAIIYLSLEGMNENYEKVRGFKWNQWVKNLELLLKSRERSKGRRPLVNLLVTTLRSYQSNYFKLLEFAKAKKIDGISFRNFRPLCSKEKKESFLFDEEKHNLFYNQIKKKAMELGVAVSCPPPFPVGNMKPISCYRKPCGQPFEVFGIQSGGEVIPCCNRPVDLGDYSPGYANIMASWTSEAFINLRKTVNSENPLPVCQHCGVAVSNPYETRPVFLSFQQKIRSFFCHGREK
ncbi:MAG TPA: radical SAM/SPASM domain-containing protein [Candidatus Omnitrophota bacterium]|nr:radical SAM/SPASM domain-containing protein [Candidatus Omnitrophota bacterium]